MAQARKDKKELIGELISEFRTSGNHDDAFDNLAAQRLGVNETDLHCLNIIQNSGGVTAGRLAREAGLTTGAVTGGIDRLQRGGVAPRGPRPGRPPGGEARGGPEVLPRAREGWGAGG